MSTLEYLEPQGNVNFYLVNWAKLHEWLSYLNGNTTVTVKVPEGLNRGNVIGEFEDRRNGNAGGGIRRVANAASRNALGRGKDWREYENAQGYTHLEELFIFQPPEWRKQAREYFFNYRYDLSRVSTSTTLRSCEVQVTQADETVSTIPIFMSTSVLAVLFHPQMSRIARYEPLNFLLSYGVVDPLADLCEQLFLTKLQLNGLLLELSPLDYFLEFQKHVEAYDTQELRKRCEKIEIPRLSLINELDFSKIIGQRLAKGVIRKEIVHHFCGRSDKRGGVPMNQPLSMIFAGPSGSGKTELAKEIAELLNRPSDNAFYKVDCGKMTDVHELFGMSVANQGAKEGSSLDNFVLSISQEPGKIGVVLLDEIDMAEEGVITGLHQVLDKGEWASKQLTTESDSQTSIISCLNIIFIMTVNAADHVIVDYPKRYPSVYTDGSTQMADHASVLTTMIENCLQKTKPFTNAFIGSVGAFVPFLPMSAQTSDTAEKLEYEMLTVAKLLIERATDQERGKDLLGIDQFMSPLVRHKTAIAMVKQANPEAGVKSIQKEVTNKITKELWHSSLLKTGGIARGSQVHYGVDTTGDKVDFKMVDLADPSLDQKETAKFNTA